MKHLFFVICIGFCLLGQSTCFSSTDSDDDNASTASSAVKPYQDDLNAWGFLPASHRECFISRDTSSPPLEEKGFTLFRRSLDFLLSQQADDMSALDLACLVTAQSLELTAQLIQSALSMKEDDARTARSRREGGGETLSRASSRRSENDTEMIFTSLDGNIQSQVLAATGSTAFQSASKDLIVHFIDAVASALDPEQNDGIHDLILKIKAPENAAVVKKCISMASATFERSQKERLATLPEGSESENNSPDRFTDHGTPQAGRRRPDVVPWSLDSAATNRSVGGAGEGSASGRPAPGLYSTPGGGKPGTGESDTDMTPQLTGSMGAGTGGAGTGAGSGAPLSATAAATAAVPVSASAAPPPAAGTGTRGRSQSMIEAYAKAKKNSGSGSDSDGKEAENAPASHGEGAGYQAPTLGEDGRTVTPPRVTGGNSGAGYGAAGTDKVPASPGQGEDTVKKNLLADSSADPSTAPKKKDGCCSIL